MLDDWIVYDNSVPSVQGHGAHRHFKKLEPDNIYCGDSRVLLKAIEADSISLSVWSPPYNVGKNYEGDLTFAE